MSKHCTHMAGIRDVTPSARGCEECLKSGRRGYTCAYAGPAGTSVAVTTPPTATHQAFPRHRPPYHRRYDPPEGWGWCYVDEVVFDLSDRATPQLGPIPRYY